MIKQVGLPDAQPFRLTPHVYLQPACCRAYFAVQQAPSSNANRPLA